jgi:hypothetical protein
LFQRDCYPVFPVFIYITPQKGGIVPAQRAKNDFFRIGAVFMYENRG